jgi:hypothetical protein
MVSSPHAAGAAAWFDATRRPRTPLRVMMAQSTDPDKGAPGATDMFKGFP